MAGMQHLPPLPPTPPPGYLPESCEALAYAEDKHDKLPVSSFAVSTHHKSDRGPHKDDSTVIPLRPAS